MLEANNGLYKAKKHKHHPKPADVLNQNYFNIPEHAPYYFPVTYQPPHSGPRSLPVYPCFYPMVDPPKPPCSPSNQYTSLPIGPIQESPESPNDRRFSDPGPCDSDSSTNSLGERVVHKLTQQVQALKDGNRKLQREVADLRTELNVLKQHNMRHYEREYEPGMLAETIKEIRDAARVREDALIAKVKHMIEENRLDMNHIQAAAEKTRNNERIVKLEEQFKNLSVNHSRSDGNGILQSSVQEESPNSARQVIELEKEALNLRRELQDARAKKEESDYKFLQLDKKLTSLLRLNKDSTSAASDDGKTSLASSADTFSNSNPTGSVYSSFPQKIVLSGPVTDL